MKCKVLIYNTKDLFDEYNSIIVKMKHLNSIVQNNVVIDYEDGSEFLSQFEVDLNELKNWKNKVLDHIHRNIISNELGESLTKILTENNGRIPGKD